MIGGEGSRLLSKIQFAYRISRQRENYLHVSMQLNRKKLSFSKTLHYFSPTAGECDDADLILLLAGRSHKADMPAVPTPERRTLRPRRQCYGSIHSGWTAGRVSLVEIGARPFRR